jgi:hypothetical protein
MAHKPEADCRMRRSEHAVRNRIQHLRDRHNAEGRPQCQQQSTSADAGDSEHNQRALGGDTINQRAGRNLKRKRCQRSDREDQDDVELRPSNGSQINSDKRAPTGLDLCHEEGKPIEAAKALARGSGVYAQLLGAVHALSLLA